MSDATGLAIVSDIVKSWAAASGEERAWKLWRSCGVKLEQFMPPGSSESDVHKHLKDQVSTRLTTAVSSLFCQCRVRFGISTERASVGLCSLP
jgi:hypothetical protein